MNFASVELLAASVLYPTKGLEKLGLTHDVRVLEIFYREEANE